MNTYEQVRYISLDRVYRLCVCVLLSDSGALWLMKFKSTLYSLC
jgi:hypothetical protein